MTCDEVEWPHCHFHHKKMGKWSFEHLPETRDSTHHLPPYYWLPTRFVREPCLCPIRTHMHCCVVSCCQQHRQDSKPLLLCCIYHLARTRGSLQASESEWFIPVTKDRGHFRVVLCQSAPKLPQFISIVYLFVVSLSFFIVTLTETISGFANTNTISGLQPLCVRGNLLTGV